LKLFTNRFERISKELKDLKKTNKQVEGSNDNDAISKLLKETEFKLKIVEKEKADLLKLEQRELDQINTNDLDDLQKVKGHIKKLRVFKFKVDDADTKLNDIEESIRDITKRLTE